MHTSILLPRNWFFKKELHGKTTSYFISKEKIENGGSFRTGLTINLVQDFSKNHRGELPAAYASRFIKGFSKQGKEIKNWSAPAGKIMSYGTQVLMQADSDDPYRVHTFAGGNNSTDTFYLFTFESPESSWNDSVKAAGVFISQLALDDEL